MPPKKKPARRTKSKPKPKPKAKPKKRTRRAPTVRQTQKVTQRVNVKVAAPGGGFNYAAVQQPLPMYRAFRTPGDRDDNPDYRPQPGTSFPPPKAEPKDNPLQPARTTGAKKSGFYVSTEQANRFRERLDMTDNDIRAPGPAPESKNEPFQAESKPDAPFAPPPSSMATLALPSFQERDFGINRGTLWSPSQERDFGINIPRRLPQERDPGIINEERGSIRARSPEPEGVGREAKYMRSDPDNEFV